MAFFNYKGKRCFYEEIGEGVPLLLLHGNTASSKMFEEIVPYFSSDYKVVLIDFLGHGKSDRLQSFPADLWYDQAMQVIEFLKQKLYKNVYIIGSSGGALVAINVALEAPNLVQKVIADSFEGKFPLKEFAKNVNEERKLSEQDESAKAFYSYMHGDDWEHVVDCDTFAIDSHYKTIGKFFHKPLNTLKSQILMTGSEEDEFISSISKDYFKNTYKEMILEIGHGKSKIFKHGNHPAMLSNKEEFARISKSFFRQGSSGDFDEIYALLSIKIAFPEYAFNMVKSESPDWKDDKNSVGLEVTKAQDNHRGYTNNMFSRYCGEYKENIPQKIIDEFLGYMQFEDGKLKAISPTNGLENGTNHIDMAISATITKLKKLNSNFSKFNTNQLYLYLYDSVFENSDFELFKNMYYSIKKDFNYYFEHIFLFDKPNVLYWLDINNDCFKKYTFNDEKLTKLYANSKNLSTKFKWNKETNFNTIYKQYLTSKEN